MTRRVTARRMPTQLGGPVRICVIEMLGGSIQRDLVAMSAANARLVAAELLALADEADIETTGGVPPTIFPGDGR